jgi:transposase-like protein
MLESVSFEALLAGTAKLSPEQREQLRLALDAGASDEDAVLAALDGRIGPERRCPHCQSVGAQKRGKANGLMRYRCTACGKSFNALTGSRLARLRKRDQWLSYARSLLRGETLLDAADACGVHVETAHRWRHRFLGTAARQTGRRGRKRRCRYEAQRERKPRPGARGSQTRRCPGTGWQRPRSCSSQLFARR